MASSAAVHDALSEVFDKRSDAVTVVSGYDETVLYANAADRHVLGPPGSRPATTTLPVDFVGRSIREVTELFGIEYDTSPIGEALASGETVVRQMPSLYWVCASVMPLSDVSKTAVGSIHQPDLTEAQARHQHSIILAQATIALEFSEAERLIQVGMEALHRSRQRIHSLRKTLLFSELTSQFPTE